MNPRNKRQSLATSVRRRPAEVTSSAVGALVAALATIFGLNLTPEVLAAVALVVGAVPAIVTGIVDWFTSR